MLEFLCRSMGRVLRREWWHKETVPQGVTVYIAHPDTETFEYLYTRDDRFDFRKDDDEKVMAALKKYGVVEKGGYVLYMHEAAMHVASKHMQHRY